MKSSVLSLLHLTHNRKAVLSKFLGRSQANWVKPLFSFEIPVFYKMPGFAWHCTFYIV